MRLYSWDAVVQNRIYREIFCCMQAGSSLIRRLVNAKAMPLAENRAESLLRKRWRVLQR